MKVGNLAETGRCPWESVGNPRKFCADTPGTVRLTDTIVVANHWTYHADKFDLKYLTGGLSDEGNTHTHDTPGEFIYDKVDMDPVKHRFSIHEIPV